MFLLSPIFYSKSSPVVLQRHREKNKSSYYHLSFVFFKSSPEKKHFSVYRLSFVCPSNHLQLCCNVTRKKEKVPSIICHLFVLQIISSCAVTSPEKK